MLAFNAGELPLMIQCDEPTKKEENNANKKRVLCCVCK
jgi:hypothetical protein